MILGLSPYFVLMDFFIYSIIGWIYESIFMSIKERHITNRGFLVGPFLPLYGFGGTLVYVFLRPIADHPSLLFISGMIVATTLEYITSMGMEKIFRAQWWDYTEYPFNFQGRIALIPSLFWGFLTIMAFDFLQPMVSAIMNHIPSGGRIYFLGGCLILFSIDFTYTLVTTLNFSKQLETLYKFRNDIILQLEDLNLPSLREAISSSTQSFSDKIMAVKEYFSGAKENIEENPKVSTMESKLKEYMERTTNLIKKNPIFGNRRIIEAFPKMKFIPKESKKLSKEKKFISVKELLISLTNKRKS